MKDSYAGSGNFKGVSWNIVFCKYHSNGFGGVEPAAGSGLLRWGGRVEGCTIGIRVPKQSRQARESRTGGAQFQSPLL